MCREEVILRSVMGAEFESAALSNDRRVRWSKDE